MDVPTGFDPVLHAPARLQIAAVLAQVNEAEFARPGAVVRAHVTEAIGPDLVAKSVVAKAARP